MIRFWRRRGRGAELVRVCAYKPEWIWLGWQTLLPLFIYRDAYGRWAVEFGCVTSGAVAIAVTAAKGAQR